MTEEQKRVTKLIRDAFRGVTLGDGVGLFQGQGLDEYADPQTVAAYRAQDQKQDWSGIPVANLNRCHTSLSFFDAEGMRFHLPAYLIADLEGTLYQDIVFYLTHFEIRGFSRFEKLSDLQRHAVREFLLLYLTSPDAEFDGPMVEKALRQYWTPWKKS
jgi:hypothetical protein